MSDMQATLLDMVQRLFGSFDYSALADEQCASAAWEEMETLGLSRLMLSEANGGFDGQWQDAVLVSQQLGRHAVPLPLVETILARHVLQQGQLPQPAKGTLAIAHCAPDDLQADTAYPRLTAQIKNIGWQNPRQLVLSGQWQQMDFIATVDAGETENFPCYRDTAGDQRIDLAFNHVAVRDFRWVESPGINLHQLGALLRTAQISGALEKLLELSLQYVSERSQFGRTISKFQVIQHKLSQLAEQCAAVDCAIRAAAVALDHYDTPQNGVFEIACAKLRANLAIAEATAIAHQLHGAMGFTREHELHRYTTRLFAWRSDFGNDRYWSTAIGKLVVSSPHNLWQLITERGDRQMLTAARS
ncbi:acyl-CoA dehydrogenase family protein [Spongiibacter marinus]|uniref:acyl-CoA dehydrogenase family protein n=1 Tax=Spongiibacter marinus TaxID=354246 RepID=UPI0035BE8B94